MNLDKVMVDSATGASPPRSSTRDVGCSPLHFLSLMKSATRIGRDVDSSSIVVNQKEQNKKENDSMNKFYDIDQTSSLSLPSSRSTSAHTTPILGSFSTTEPVALMSLNTNDRYDIRAQQSSFQSHTHRWWPVDRRSSSRSDYEYHRYNPYVRGYGGDSGGARGRARAMKKQDGWRRRNAGISTGDCDHCGTIASRQFCKSHCRCI